MKWPRQFITREDGTDVEAQAPLIISASRSTDIPAFYSDWFFHRLNVGYSAWINPFTKEKSYITYNKCKFIVFWSKNPKPLIPHLDELKERGIGCYVQYTLNDYEKEGLEKGVPSLEERIETFKALVDKLGKGNVIWRFDPLILTDEITIPVLLDKIKKIGDKLLGYTDKLVFSFADISTYKKVQNNLNIHGIHYQEWDEESELKFAATLAELNKFSQWNYKLATCGEKVDLSEFGIEHNKCIDDELITKISYKDKELMDFLGIKIKCVDDFIFGSDDMPKDAIVINSDYYGVRSKSNKDTGQRALCGCIVSKDIGQYNTCPHMCEYCYANSDKTLAAGNYGLFVLNGGLGETII